MRLAFVSEPEMDGGRHRCTMRSIARVVDTEPEDAVKARGTSTHAIETEPSNAAKGDPATRTPGAIRC